MEKKYEFTGHTKRFMGHTLHRIVAVRDFADVKTGELGGWVESESNLSHSGSCWLYNDAMVYANGKVMEDACLFGESVVHDFGVVKGRVAMFNKADVYDDAVVSGDVMMFNRSNVGGKAKVSGFTQLYDYANVTGNADVSDYTSLAGNVVVKGDIKIAGSVNVVGMLTLTGDAVISSRNDFMQFTNCWSSGRDFIWTRSNNMWSVGCFYGTGEELVKKAYEDSEESGHNYECVVNMVKNII